MLALTSVLLAVLPGCMAAPLADLCLLGLPSFPINVTEYASAPWYEVASSYLAYTYIEAGCQCVQAHYNATSSLGPGMVGVRNYCWLGATGGGWRTAEGEATLSTDPARPGDVTVRFPGAPEEQSSFSAIVGSLPNYIVAKVWEEPGEGGRYAQAVVIGPCRSYAWVLSRTPVLEAGRWEEIQAWMAGEGGLDLGDLLLQRTVHSDCPPLPPAA